EDQPARVTDELLGGRGGGGAMLQGPLALGADEDFEQVGGEAHGRAYPRRWSDGASRRQRGSTFTWRSRYTVWPTSVSILVRAAFPSDLNVPLHSPTPVPFWLSRSL